MSEPQPSELDGEPSADAVEREPAPGPPATPSIAPLRPRSCMGSFWALLGSIVGAIYLLNPTLGLFELLPANAPGIGNLDEAGAAALLIFGLRYLLVRRR